MSVDDTTTPVLDRFRSALAGCLPVENQKIGLAVSGGGDSIALMHLATHVLGPRRLSVISIDHGLRAEAKQELALVAQQAAALELDHSVTSWTWDGSGNLQASARAGRWDAIYQWSLAHNIRHVMLGHTEDDQVETVLMRLARGSGIDGLTAMYAKSQRDGLRVCRPMLSISRDDLRGWLMAEGIAWCDDPSNDDPRFDRVRARQMFTQLEDLGLTRKRLLQTIEHMQAAHISLEAAARQFAQDHVRQDAGDLIFTSHALDLGKADAPRRVMAAAINWVGSRAYRPRFAQLLDAVAQASKGNTATLGGCIMTPQSDGTMRLSREAAATNMTTGMDQANDATAVFWDQRWVLEGPIDPSLSVKALGEGIRHCPDWRAVGMPRTSLLASPSVWRGDILIAAPLASFSNGWSARIVADFHSTAFAIED